MLETKPRKPKTALYAVSSAAEDLLAQDLLGRSFFMEQAAPGGV